MIPIAYIGIISEACRKHIGSISEAERPFNDGGAVLFLRKLAAICGDLQLKKVGILVWCRLIKILNSSILNLLSND